MTTVRPLPPEEYDRHAALLGAWAFGAAEELETLRFGDAEVARRELVRWAGRPASEVGAGRWLVALDRGQPVGGAVAIAGEAVAAARRADLLALVEVVGNTPAVRSRLTLIADSFAPISPDELYLSRLFVAPPARGKGIGRRLLEDVGQVAVARGLRRVRLDVASHNTVALALYADAGFVPSPWAQPKPTAHAFLPLVLVLEGPTEPHAG